MTDLTLTTSRVIKAPQKTIYEAWLDPGMLAKFMLAAPNMTIPSATTDPRVGGRFDILMQMEENTLPHGGKYLELTPHSRIVFTWESPYSVEGSTVTVELRPQEDGTEVVLSHVKFRSEESRDNHRNGWSRILEVLADVV